MEYNTTEDPAKNRWLLLRDGVKRTTKTDPVIARLDEYFFLSHLVSYVTDVLRTPEDQVALIMRYAKSEKLDVQFKATDFAVVGTDGHYVWQMTWSILLSKGYLINPPMAAKVLTDYVKDGINKKGQTIMQSAHFAGKCFDIGGYDAADPTVTNEQAVTELAMRSQVGIKDITVERKNNCVHVCVV